MSESNAPPPSSNVPPSEIPPTPPPPVTDDAASAQGAYTGPPPTADDKTMGMLAHLLGIFSWFIGPLVIWLIKKDQSPFVDDQGKEALNFQITMAIGWAIVIVMPHILCVGILIRLAIFAVNLTFCVMASVDANKGVAYRYPFNLRLIK